MAPAALTRPPEGGKWRLRDTIPDPHMPSLHDFSANALDGTKMELSRYKGKVVLVVNTASHCGLTPHYAGLEALHEKYHGRGLEVLGFPCNQFGAQEPGGAGEIAAFCQKNFGVRFQMFEKIEVNGAGAHSLYQWLTASSPGQAAPEPIKWNFAKFLIGKDGAIVRRYAPQMEPADIDAEIAPLLKS